MYCSGYKSHFKQVGWKGQRRALITVSEDEMWNKYRLFNLTVTIYTIANCETLSTGLFSRNSQLNCWRAGVTSSVARGFFYPRNTSEPWGWLWLLGIHRPRPVDPLTRTPMSAWKTDCDSDLSQFCALSCNQDFPWAQAVKMHTSLYISFSFAACSKCFGLVS